MISGIWKFSGTTSIEQLITTAQSLMKQDNNYLHLSIRRVSETDRGITFLYRLNPDESETIQYNSYLAKTVNVLRDTYGTNLVGWDLGVIEATII